MGEPRLDGNIYIANKTKHYIKRHAAAAFTSLIVLLPVIDDQETETPCQF